MTPKGKESQSSDLSRRSRTPYGPEARNLLPIEERETDIRNPDELHTEPYDIRIQPRRREDAEDEVHLRAVSRHADAGRHPQRATTTNYNDVSLKWCMWEAFKDIARSPPRLQECKIDEWKRDIATAQGAIREMEQENSHERKLHEQQRTHLEQEAFMQNQHVRIQAEHAIRESRIIHENEIASELQQAERRLQRLQADHTRDLDEIKHTYQTELHRELIAAIIQHSEYVQEEVQHQVQSSESSSSIDHLRYQNSVRQQEVLQ